ncbi:hemerythrin domain-containing protein [Cohnella faecalis]|uniref:Hemerythrin-like domain-containing protein n=1 Tax=Cohnella faecalis TaxID=2315694 RepID=A0A398CL93_9BACL|nr:hemerythrin domain-containing protein [Cohnella faecalis]RIE03433.1 hypothetical protein D3H35_12270 [Cohnella faecalis]
MPHSNPPMLELYREYDQWKAEHEELQVEVRLLCAYVQRKRSSFDYERWERQHEELDERFRAFMSNWHRLLNKERRAIYPIAKPLTGGRAGPIAVLEQDGQIADLYYAEYVKLSAEGALTDETLTCLHQCLLIVSEHFRIENEVLLPVTEMLMDHIELGSL